MSHSDEDLPEAFPSELPEPAGEEPPPAEFTPALDPALEGSGGGEPLPEGADADQSLDDLLATELLPEPGAELTPPPEAISQPALPSFQLFFPFVPEAAKAELKKLFAAQGLIVPERDRGGPPTVSQLNELQAVRLLQGARALGLECVAELRLPEAAPQEDELALGALSAIPDSPAQEQESAPSVSMAGQEKEVILSSPDELPGASLVESFGIVVAHRSIPQRLFREDEMEEKLRRELRAVPGPGSPLPDSRLQLTLRELFFSLRKQALGRGGNAVLGVKVEVFPEKRSSDPELEQLRLIAFGTAAVVEKT